MVEVVFNFDAAGRIIFNRGRQAEIGVIFQPVMLKDEVGKHAHRSGAQMKGCLELKGVGIGRV